MMDDAEYKEFVESAYHGRVLIGVDRIFARRVYTDIPTSTIQEAILHAGSVHVRTELGIAVDLMHYPVIFVLAPAVGFEPLLPGAGQVFLVILIRADSRVERYSWHSSASYLVLP